MANNADILALDTSDLRARLAQGALSAVEVTEAYLAQIARREADVGAWAWIDPDYARAQAQHLDAQRKAGRPLGRLHGLPVGLKDVIDTAKIPTENGCPLDAGRVPSRDAYVVERLKAEGAVLMGKTVTTELAFMQARGTRNPHNPGHTPGGWTMANTGFTGGVAVAVAYSCGCGAVWVAGSALS